MKWDGIIPVVAVTGMVVGLIIYNNMSNPLSDANYAPQDDREHSCTKVAGTPEERLEKCIADMAESRMSEAARTQIRKISDSGTIFKMANVDLGLPYLSLVEKPEVRDVLLGTNEEDAAKALTGMGVRGFVINRDVTYALDRDRVVLSRLAHHDFLEWFQLRYVTEDLFVYTVRDSHMRMPLATGNGLIRALRARIEGKPFEKQRWNPKNVRLMASIRLQGNQLALRHTVSETGIEWALNDLAAKLTREWERKAVPEGHGVLTDRLSEVRFDVHIVMERARVEPRSRIDIFDLFELGVDGMMFSHAPGVKEDKFTYYPGSEAVARSMRSPDAFLQKAVKVGGWHDQRPWEDRKTQLDVIRTQHFIEDRAGGGHFTVRLIRGLPEVPMSHVTDKNVQQMLIDGGEWWLENMFEDGSFEYKYWPTQNRRSEEYNEVRHILGARDLADAWRYRNDDRFLEGSRKSMDWLLKYQVHDTDKVDPTMPHPPPGTMLFRYPKATEALKFKKPVNQKLGTVAVALLGWLAWADATGSHEEDERIRKQAKFVLAMAAPNGKFKPYLVPKGHAYEHEDNDIVPGEAALALGLVAEYFDEPDEWLGFYPKFLEYYVPWFRSRAVNKDPFGRWPHNTYDNQTRLDLVQFGPWSVMAAKQYYKMTGDVEAAEFGLEVADWMIDNYQWTQERSPWPDYVGGYYKLPQELPAMQSFCYSEGTTAAYTIAAKLKPKQRHKYLVATEESIRFMELMQYDKVDSYYVAKPGKVFGGIKYAMNENKIRIDYVGHGLSTLSQYLDAKVYDPATELDIRDPSELVPWPPRRVIPKERLQKNPPAGAQKGGKAKAPQKGAKGKVPLKGKAPQKGAKGKAPKGKAPPAPAPK